MKAPEGSAKAILRASHPSKSNLDECDFLRNIESRSERRFPKFLFHPRHFLRYAAILSVSYMQQLFAWFAPSTVS